ncbi:MAG: SpoIID/LytB domain-containing protein [Pelosinus sp.]|nr:SpoIID/LytB domain-containing protein [Pelosinus sp.]
MHFRKQGIAVLMALFFVVSLIGCGMLNTPQQKPEDTPPPVVPQANQGVEPDILVFMHQNGEKKTMKMEDYIAGVVAGEMKNNWPVEALAAQAILARTFTVQAIADKGGVPERGTQASTDIKEFQAYDANAINDAVRQAVTMTRGMIIVYQGQPIHAWFHASAGGITATAKEGLNYKEMEPPYIVSVPSPDDGAPADVKNWTATFSKKQVVEASAKIGKTVTGVNTIALGQKGPSGRTQTLMINGNTEVAGPDFRVALDGTKLKSMLLDKVEISGDNVIFTGKGYGHGVGMSQWGAYQLAGAGKKSEEIIGHYFKNVTIEKRWN